MRKYYEAYEERYKTAHGKGVSWSSDKRTPVVLDMIKKYGISASHHLLEIGCGEGRDARAVMEKGYDLLATDISEEAILYCKSILPQYKEHFGTLNCLMDEHNYKYEFIYSVAVIHMLVLDEDRALFYQFIREHLTCDGFALICTMGDGKTEMQSDIRKAFKLQEREHESGKMVVTGTSCRMVSFETFEKEIKSNGLALVEKGITTAFPDFDSLMFAVVVRQ